MGSYRMCIFGKKHVLGRRNFVSFFYCLLWLIFSFSARDTTPIIGKPLALKCVIFHPYLKKQQLGRVIFRNAIFAFFEHGNIFRKDMVRKELHGSEKKNFLNPQCHNSSGKVKKGVRRCLY